MSDNTETTDIQNGGGSTVDQIKSLIFGNEIKRFNEQFEALEKQLDENKRLFDKTIQLLSEEVAGNLANLDASVQAKLEAHKELIDREIQKLNMEKVDRTTLKEGLQKMAGEV